MIRTRVTVLVAAATALLLGACGTTENTASTEPTAGSSGGPVTVTDSRGKEIKLDAPATKVVALEWAEAEMLVGLGVMPVGVADAEGYATWVTAAKLDGSVKDVGTRAEPSVDSIVALEPDLVVMEGGRGNALVDQLEKHVPVLVAKGSDATDNLGRMRSDVTMVATAVGKSAEGEKLLADFDTAIAEGKKKIADAGAAGKSFAIADGWKEGSSVTIRMFGEGALVSQVGIQLGLRNAWTGESDEVWGLGQTDVEGLNALKDQDLEFFYNASDGDDVFAEGLADNAIWKSFNFVKEGNLHRMPDGTWTFGGPLSAKQYLDELVKVYTV
ncbi:iron-siderophore ABC transporter substrate-binding protein [Micromonospora sp. NPDC000207]|uniref:ABC transporter substrate-binding protein n=1 Tax=Micromonospora sp. NPDC000207 TaxID=3154246 RepID=UPI003331818E